MKSVIRRILNSIWFDISHPSLTNFNYYLNFFYNFAKAKVTKEVDYSSEMFHWEQAYYKYFASGKHPNWWNSNLTKDRYSEETKEILEILSKDFNEELKLIDVGSGPVTSFFGKIDINAWDITTVDPLAKLYNYLNKKYNVNYPIKCIEGTGEHLYRIFGPNTFHIVLSQNAIDHSTSPIDFINNLYYICKPRGFIYLSGFIREGSAANWMGLHKHDLYVEGGDLYWTKHDKSINNLNITENLNMTLFYKQVEGPNIEDRFILVYRKMA